MSIIKVLVTGSNGFIGSKLIEKLCDNPMFNVVGLSIGENRIEDINFEYSSVDLRNDQEVASCFQKIQPDVVIHTAAISQVDVCKKNLDLCYKVNVIATKTLAYQCRKYHAKLILVSSDFVFDGSQKWVTDTALPNPISIYGESKLKAELIVSQLPNWAIVRPVLVYGFSKSASRGNIFTWVLNSLKNRTQINVVNDQFRTPTFVGDLVELIVKLITYSKNDYFNLGGGNRVSVFEFAEKIAQINNFGADNLISVSSKSVDNAEFRPINSCFKNEKIIKEFSIKPLGVDAGIKAALEQFE